MNVNPSRSRPSISFSIASALLAAVAFSSSITLVSAKKGSLRCKKTDVLLRVKYLFDLNTVDSIIPRGSSYPTVSVRPSGNIGKSTFTQVVRYGHNAFGKLANEYEVCIPKENSCIEVVVSVLPSNAYEISWNGQPIAVQNVYPYEAIEEQGIKNTVVTTTEVGNTCAPICDINEALFDIQYWTGGVGHGNPNYVAIDDFRVVQIHDGTFFTKDDESSNPLFGCSGNDCRAPYFSMYKHRECLPKDVCYEFNIGSQQDSSQVARYDDKVQVPGKSSYSIHYDGQLIDTKTDWHFESIRFGHNCQAHTCNLAVESTVEFFMHQYAGDIEACDPKEGCRLQLELTIDNKRGLLLHAEKDIQLFSEDTDFILIHETICVPKKSCSSLHITSANTERFLYFAPRYMVSMDGVAYKNTKFWSKEHEELDDVTVMGHCPAVVAA